jgi:CHAD domain-containing protein
VKKILTFQFVRMLQHEQGAIEGDQESVHDMRVAIRRMRSLIRVFKPYLPKDRIKALKKGLKATTRSLGTVRDLDVFHLHFDEYIQEQSSWREEAFGPLLDLWLEKHAAARQELVAYLKGSDYRSFVGELSKFLNKFEKWSAEISAEQRENRVHQIVPSIIYNLDRNVRVMERDLTNASIEKLHRLRIELKRYRYTLEFFESVLGNSCSELIEEIIKIQDHLGSLHDAHFALLLVRSQIDEHDPDQIHNRASEQYALHLEKHITAMLESFPDAWKHFISPGVREQLAAAVAAL